MRVASTGVLSVWGASVCIHKVPSAHVDSVKVPTARARLLRREGGLLVWAAATGGVCTT
jgi:hypothetical protein